MNQLFKDQLVSLQSLVNTKVVSTSCKYRPSTCIETSKLLLQLLTLRLPRKDWFFEKLSRSHGDVRCLVAHQIVTSIRGGLVTHGGATPYRLSDEDALTRARLLMATYFYVCHSNAWSYRPSIALPSPTVKLSLFHGPIKQGQSYCSL